ncbi:MAG TPA: N-acetyltransferase [Pyrinomonadaceae bacterium]|nr:N-acetyltransferase [Pyrinomonadaceae bacterium]
MVIIRAENAEDREAVRKVNESAFGRVGEADLVDALRENEPRHISLVADDDGRVVGHIFFSPVTVESSAGDWAAMGLAPMAVLPEFQGRGVGSGLVREGLAECLRAGHEVVVVLGHADYYPRFGFTPARSLGIECEFPVPEENFMVAELKDGALAGRKGKVRYRPEFRSV